MGGKIWKGKIWGERKWKGKWRKEMGKQKMAHGKKVVKESIGRLHCKRQNTPVEKVLGLVRSRMSG